MDRRKFLRSTGAAAMTAALPAISASPGKLYAGSYQGPQLIGEMRRYKAKHKDTLLDIARRNGLGFVELVAANPGVDPWLPGEGREILIPGAHLLPDGPRDGLLLNLIDQRLYQFTPAGAVKSYPIGTGREAWNTPVGSTTIQRKKRNPTWFVPKSVREEDPELPAVVRPGPDNPLGRHAFYLGWHAYLIHGTNKPWGVGRRVSHGCIRMYPEDISSIFDKIPVGTKVTVTSQEAKIAWLGDNLMLEIHPNGEQNLALEATGKFAPAAVPELAYRIKEKAGTRLKDIDWEAVRKTERERKGFPVSIVKHKKTAPEKLTPPS